MRPEQKAPDNVFDARESVQNRVGFNEAGAKSPG